MKFRVLLVAAAVLFSEVLSTAQSTRPIAKAIQPQIAFEQNQGQVDPQVRYLGHAGKSTAFLTPAEAVIATAAASSQKREAAVSVLHLKWVGANPRPETTVENKLAGKVNYLIGADPKRWHTNLPTYGRVRYHNLFAGTDAVFYGKDGQLEYDLVVAPGSDPHNIRFAFEGAESMLRDSNGDLVLKMKDGEMRQHRPRAYQEVAGKRQWLAASYVIRADKTIGIDVANFDPARALVIDPTLAYSTYIGGSGGDDSVNGVAVDQFGRAYATGITVSGFPTKNPLEGNRLGTDAFVTKFFATGGGLIYSTYLGGSSADQGNAIAVDRFGNAYVAGETSSTDFPVTAGAFNPGVTDNDDGFITKISPSGSSLVYSLRLGGGDLDTIRALALDSSQRVYVTGFTCSTNFPAKNAFKAVTNSQNCADGGGDAFVTRVNAAGTALEYSTYLDGSIFSIGNGIAVDSTFHAYVTGSTESADFPTTPGAFQRTFKAATVPGFPHDTIGRNAFVTKFSADGRTLAYSSFLGGTVDDEGTAIAVDGSGRAYVTGAASSKDFPVTSGAFQKTLRGNSDAFVTKFFATGGGVIYSTFLGGSQGDGGGSIAVDSFGRAHVAGGTFSTDFPVLNAIQSHSGGALDAFVTKLSATGGSLIYSTYLGGSGADGANCIRLDSSGNAYVGGSTTSTNFRTTAGAFSRTKKTGSDGWVAKIKP
jgi:beta-propeller repeat-containing protein